MGRGGGVLSKPHRALVKLVLTTHDAGHENGRVLRLSGGGNCICQWPAHVC